MAFKLNKGGGPSAESPESLFRDIKTKKVQGALADQADLWRAYQETAIDLPDVALQLPTGGGKTLVALVLAEWRRIKFQQRVVYLCPTKQLVNQVVDQAINHYGIRVHGFTGSKYDYDNDATAEYLNCERIAVTNYSSLFNSAPYFDNAHVIVLDDAHACEQYVASMWSMSIERSIDKHKALYEAIVAVLSPAISKENLLRLTDPDPVRDNFWVEKIPSPTLWELVPELVSVCDATISRSDYDVTEHMFSWRAIRDHLEACHLYIGPGSILIRPLLPPTSTHAPFAQAKQRIYMSATFGESGELERITGRSQIARLQTKKASWDRQTIGRRYFMFPARSLPDDEQNALCAKVMSQAGRTLVLTPDKRRAKLFSDFVSQTIHFPVFDAQAIESSKQKFVASDRAVAIVANRYDGIDFPEDQCRLLIIEGLPRATNLQEQFLITRMGAVDLLSVRIMTRLVQAFGRCTRSDKDFSAVVILGEELNKHLMTPERRALLHPELQAELEFGLDQAKGTTVDGFVENLGIFLSQDEQWLEADAHIRELRNDKTQSFMPGAKILSDVVSLEIEYQQFIWNKDYESAFGRAREVLGKLTEPSLRGYRCLWHYLAGSAAWLAYKNGSSGFDARAREQYLSSLKTERSLAWLVPLTKLAVMKEEDLAVVQDKGLWNVIERLESRFDSLGTLTDHKYDKAEAEVRQLLGKNDAKSFELGHAKLGELLGYDAGNRNDTGSPDPWWIAHDGLCFIFEDHSDANQQSALSVDKARQACTHPNWVKENLPVAEGAKIVAILITPVEVADDAALVHLNEVLHWDLQDFRVWASTAVTTVRELRKQYPGSGDLAWRALAAEKLSKANIAPETLLAMLEPNIAAQTLRKP